MSATPPLNPYGTPYVARLLEQIEQGVPDKSKFGWVPGPRLFCEACGRSIPEDCRSPRWCPPCERERKKEKDRARAARIRRAEAS